MNHTEGGESIEAHMSLSSKTTALQGTDSGILISAPEDQEILQELEENLKLGVYSATIAPTKSLEIDVNLAFRPMHEPKRRKSLEVGH